MSTPDHVVATPLNTRCACRAVLPDKCHTARHDFCMGYSVSCCGVPSGIWVYYYIEKTAHSLSYVV